MNPLIDILHTQDITFNHGMLPGEKINKSLDGSGEEEAIDHDDFFIVDECDYMMLDNAIEFN